MKSLLRVGGSINASKYSGSTFLFTRDEVGERRRRRTLKTVALVQNKTCTSSAPLWQKKGDRSGNSRYGINQRLAFMSLSRS